MFEQLEEEIKVQGRDNAQCLVESTLTYSNTGAPSFTGMNMESTSPLIFTSLFHSTMQFGNHETSIKFL